MLTEIIHYIFLIFFLYFGLIIIYFFIISVAGRLYSPPGYTPVSDKRSIAVLIPAYRENEIIFLTANSARHHNYPEDKFDIYVGADQLTDKVIQELRSIGVNVLELNFENSTKARALNKLLNHIPEDRYDIALILDADNIMSPGCLEQINSAFARGFNGVQLHRTAKNDQNNIALLDGMSEAINNHLFRRSLRALGFSSHTIGSGMAFNFNRLKQIYNKPGILDNPACDREVDFELMRNNEPIEFIDTAYIFDEKVSNIQVFQKQRTRWMESQIIHMKLFLKAGLLIKNKDYWNKLFSLFIPPRLLLLLILPVIIMLGYLTGKFWNIQILYPPLPYWIAIFTLYLATILIALPLKYYNRRSLLAMVSLLPMTWSFLKAITKLKPKRKEFLHTSKTFKQESE